MAFAIWGVQMSYLDNGKNEGTVEMILTVVTFAPMKKSHQSKYVLLKSLMNKQNASHY